jgi:DNA-dependent RNA polymerase auxiliary subunit epsilon
LSTDVSEVRAASITLMMEAVRTSETSVDNYFTRQYIPEDKYELQFISPVYHDSSLFLLGPKTALLKRSVKQ